MLTSRPSGGRSRAAAADLRRPSVGLLLGALLLAFSALTFVLLLETPAARAAAITYNIWRPQVTGISSTLYGVALAGPSDAWAVGYGGAIVHTSGSTTWTTQTSGTTETLYGVDSISSTEGWAVGDQGTILHTVDAGTSWHPQDSGVTVALQAVHCLDADNGIAVGAGGTILRTADGGLTWSQQASGTSATLNGLAFCSRDTGWAVGSHGVVLKTSDGGASWSRQSSGTALTLFGAACLDADTAWVVGSNGALRHTSDGGATWMANRTETAKPLLDIEFNDPAHGWLTCRGKRTFETADAGSTWELGASAACGLRALACENGVVCGVGDWGLAVMQTIDYTPPVTVAGGLAVDENSEWKGSPQVVSFAASDTLSGVEATYFSVDGAREERYQGPFTVAGDGQHEVRYWSIDAAGNEEAPKCGWVNIFSADLRVVASGLAADARSAWHPGAADVTIAVTSDSHPDLVNVCYRVDGGRWRTEAVRATFAVRGDGTHLVQYYALGPAGQTSEQQSGYVNIDTAAPVTCVDSVPLGWHARGATVEFAAHDAASGVADTLCTIDGSPAQSASSITIPAPADHSMDGVHIVRYWSVDEAGNTEKPTQIVVCIDTRAPTVKPVRAVSVCRKATVKLDIRPNDPKPSSGRVTIRVQVRNARNKVVLTRSYAKVRTGARFAPKLRCSLPAGTYKYSVEAIDAAGNAQGVPVGNKLRVR